MVILVGLNMAHYALLNDENIVVSVITGVDENDLDSLPAEFTSWEEFYLDFHNGKNEEIVDCKRTSYNTWASVHTDNGTPFRGNYAGKGDTYDVDNDVFITQNPSDDYKTYILNTEVWTWELQT